MIAKEDYEEPACLLNMRQGPSGIPAGRVLSRLDEYFSRNDYSAAERHLDYWLSEAELCHDERGKLILLNERIGLFRKTDQREKCLEAIEAALELSEKVEAGTISRGTTLVNAATGAKACGLTEKAAELYCEAKIIYEALLPADDARLGALYNNMAVTLADMKRTGEARELYEKAIAIMLRQPRGELEAAVSFLNIADLINIEKGTEQGEAEITRCLEKAEEFLDAGGSERDGYYAFICEKCAPSFGYYGYFLTEKRLRETAKEIYERT